MLVFSQALPRSSPRALAMAAAFSMTLPTTADRQNNRKLGAVGSSRLSTRVRGSVARMRSATLSRVKPNWLMMKAGDLFMITARRSDHAASSAVTGLPDAKRGPWRRWKVNMRPSAATSQRSASSPVIWAGLSFGVMTSFWYTLPQTSAPLHSKLSAGSTLVRSLICLAISRTSGGSCAWAGVARGASAAPAARGACSRLRRDNTMISVFLFPDCDYRQTASGETTPPGSSTGVAPRFAASRSGEILGTGHRFRQRRAQFRHPSGRQR